MALNPLMTDWQGKVVWMIGASTGIGRATASALHAKGAKVWVSARQAQALDAFAIEHPGAQALPLDVTHEGALKEALHTLLLQSGRLDLVVYCVGHYKPQSALAFDLDEMHKHHQLNVVGAWQCLQACLPVLLAQRGGHLSLVSSVAGYRGLHKALAYGPTKAALQNLAEVLYLDLHPKGLGVSVVNPGFVQTPLTAQNDFQMPALISPEQAASAILQGWARGRFEIHFPKRFTLWLKLMRHLSFSWYFGLVQRLAH